MDAKALVGWTAGSAVAHVIGDGLAAGMLIAAHGAGVLGHAVLPSLALGLGAGLMAGATIAAITFDRLPGFEGHVSRTAWIGGTVGGALVVWTIAALVPALMFEGSGRSEPPASRLALLVCVGAGAGMLRAAFQASALAGLGIRLRPWLAGNGAGWALAAPLAFALAGRPWVSLSTVMMVVALLGAGGAIAGATTAFTFWREDRRRQLIGQSTGRTCAIELV